MHKNDRDTGRLQKKTIVHGVDIPLQVFGIGYSCHVGKCLACQFMSHEIEPNKGGSHGMQNKEELLNSNRNASVHELIGNDNDDIMIMATKMLPKLE